MQIIVNKDLSISAIEPQIVYQGSTNAAYISVFAPFSVSSYGAIELYFELPSGEVLKPYTAFGVPQEGTPFGVWSAPIDDRVTQMPGYVSVSMCFIGQTEQFDNGVKLNTRLTTEAARFRVEKGIIPSLPPVPMRIYTKICLVPTVR